MKKKVVSLMAACILLACKNKPEQEMVPAGPQPEKEPTAQTVCYSYQKGKDTITAHFMIEGKQVTGDLAYRFFEKDKSSGPFRGTISGDTIYGEYSFASEGTQSVREIVFLRQGNKLVEGSGDIEEQAGKVVFKDRAALSFNDNLVLDKTVCE